MAKLYIKAGDTSGILDVLIHIWVLYYPVIGVINGRRLKHFPKNPFHTEEKQNNTEEKGKT